MTPLPLAASGLNRARTLLARHWQARTARERRLLTLTALVLGLLALLMLADWLHVERKRLDRALPKREAQLARMQEDASEMARLRQSPPTGSSSPSVATQVDAVSAAARSRGLNLTIQPAGDKVQLSGQVAFDALAAWLASLHRDQGLQVHSADLRSEGEAVVVDILLGSRPER